MDRSKLKGRQAEADCCAYLRGKGYEILGMNFSCRGGEIDLIAAKDGFVAFVEVKERANRRFGEAREAVTYAKQRRVRLAAQHWLAANETELQPRFDVVEVYPGEKGPEIYHIENAFE